ncbi:MAG: hypothetical protein DRR16_21695 [Candidatus Parabeggiatoa sp. nov. 3]|nr:MAG: hypothetical protein DRQ99_13560 [Gammaproteobacteria bacterium]RKZ81644.1 MAG: hypothetical protein DRR16_21695 [Gammaproteobacteria bacterium]
MYITSSQLIVFFGALEIAQLATPLRYFAITPELLILTSNEEDRSGYTAEEIEAANETLAVVEEAITYASQEMDSYFVKNYNLPLSENILETNPISGFCGDIVRYRLSKSHPKQEIKDRYESCLRWLRDIATGKAGIVDLETESGATPTGNKILIQQTLSNFNWGKY